MQIKRLLTSSFIVIICIIFLNDVYADEIEQKFKDMSAALLKESTQQTLQPSDKYKNLLEDLRDFVKTYPHNAWAADAQYLVATFSVIDPKQKAKELEKVLSDYPDIQIKDWTKENFGFLLPATVDEARIRFELCCLYKEIGEADKLKSLSEESMKKFPEKAQYFERLLK